MRKDDVFPRLRLGEVVVLLLVVAGGLTALIVNARSSRPPRLVGPAAHRLDVSHGNYWMAFPRRTTVANARHRVLATFPSDTQTIDFIEKAFCDVLIVRSDRLSQLGLFPGVVDIEFLTGRTPSKLTLFRSHDVNLALITLLQSPDQRPSC
jgi:hypothetical protein